MKNLIFSILRCVGGILLVLFASAVYCGAQRTAEFHRTLTVANEDPVTLSLDLSTADLDILYSRDGQVSITSLAQTSGDLKIDENDLQAALAVEQAGNKLTIRQALLSAFPDAKMKIRYRIEVPYRTAVTSTFKSGRQVISGVSGPVDISGDRGDVSVSYVSQQVRVQVGIGNVDLQVIGEHSTAITGSGNISGQRLPHGITAETGDGDITLMVIGVSEATVKSGAGRIDVGGAREGLVSSTDRGDLHVRAVPHSDWKLNSESGTIRVELPEKVDSDLLASTESGEIQFERDDLPKPLSDAHQISQRLNGGGKKIDLRTRTGRIVIR